MLARVQNKHIYNLLGYFHIPNREIRLLEAGLLAHAQFAQKNKK